MTTSEEVARILLKIKAITLSPSKPYRFVSGLLSPIYTDNRLLISYPKERKKIVKFLADKIKEVKIEPEVVAGTATAGIPHAAWVADSLKLPMIYVRSGSKDHGRGKEVEGVLGKKQKAVVIEDLISTGGSALNTVGAIRRHGGKVDTIVAIFDYEMPISTKSFKKSKIKLIPLTTLSTLVSVASKYGYLKPKDREVVLEWAKDTQGWGKKMGFE
ncbi:MAG: orotate phosphoribosyltransferase [Candidatus Woykebacteria bacterium RBG_13_40_7b]|uniref:Orotate phosphoribosyltransferase n=1 Tax=Candidatus Woykebacteria bacterium RBG_13_40_7b TaxID=1802594 RepID=A0A1G1WB70_9BACT|nr:MAG: orotate phosphoribosyltransferase [Candidatus Woykebacteria bacterium RBG_13_40_7b]